MSPAEGAGPCASVSLAMWILQQSYAAGTAARRLISRSSRLRPGSWFWTACTVCAGSPPVARTADASPTHVPWCRLDQSEW